MSYCRVFEAGMYIYPNSEGIVFMHMPAELKEIYIPDDNLDILLYLMNSRHKKEMKERIKHGKGIYEKYKKELGVKYYGSTKDI